MRKVLLAILAVSAAIGRAMGQETASPNDIQEGHKLAIMVCANCHLAASDQREQPILRPPAPSFASIVQRKDVTADWLQNFMKTTHRGIDNPQGMPNPSLLDFQLKQVSAYLLSLRKTR